MIAEPITSPYPFAQIIGYRNVLCTDGKRRKVRVGEPDTAFTVPGRVSVKGKTVTGIVQARERPDGQRDLWFYPRQSGRNHALLPAIAVYIGKPDGFGSIVIPTTSYHEGDLLVEQDTDRIGVIIRVIEGIALNADRIVVSWSDGYHAAYWVKLYYGDNRIKE